MSVEGNVSYLISCVSHLQQVICKSHVDFEVHWEHSAGTASEGRAALTEACDYIYNGNSVQKYDLSARFHK